MSKLIDVKILNPFFTSSFEVISEMAEGAKVTKGKLSLTDSSKFKSKGLAVIIGVTGVIEGRVILDMPISVAVKLASLMNFEEITKSNELVRSSLGELGNMISGKAVSRLMEQGYQLNITPPSVFEGEGVTVSDTFSQQNIQAPLILDFGVIDVNLALRFV
ncbi:MAG: chemotaxis protein CheX [Candidatus Cloacimonadota bacterium]|nr:MAG: chemotaxis protein CheX [Candidatus Cloacimonadota bacterium]